MGAICRQVMPCLLYLVPTSPPAALIEAPLYILVTKVLLIAADNWTRRVATL